MTAHQEDAVRGLPSPPRPHSVPRPPSSIRTSNIRHQEDSIEDSEPDSVPHGTLKPPAASLLLGGMFPAPSSTGFPEKADEEVARPLPPTSSGPVQAKALEASDEDSDVRPYESPDRDSSPIDFPVRTRSDALPPPKASLEEMLRNKPVKQVCQIMGAHLEDISNGRAKKEDLSHKLWKHLTANDLRLEAMSIIRAVDSFREEELQDAAEQHDMLTRRALGFIFVSLTVQPASEFCLYRKALTASLDQLEKA